MKPKVAMDQANPQPAATRACENVTQGNHEPVERARVTFLTNQPRKSGATNNIATKPSMATTDS